MFYLFYAENLCLVALLLLITLAIENLVVVKVLDIVYKPCLAEVGLANKTVLNLLEASKQFCNGS